MSLTLVRIILSFIVKSESEFYSQVQKFPQPQDNIKKAF